MAVSRKVLFVCLGNICRSPIAEAVFLDLIKKRGVQDKWVADSAAIGGWHVGSVPDQRTRDVLRKHDVPYDNRARQDIACYVICLSCSIDVDDFHDFDFIFGMDENNMSSLKTDAPENCKAKILLLGDFDPNGERIIRDPYYDHGSDGFEKCYQQCVRCCNAFLDQHK